MDAGYTDIFLHTSVSLTYHTLLFHNVLFHLKNLGVSGRVLVQVHARHKACHAHKYPRTHTQDAPPGHPPRGHAPPGHPPGGHPPGVQPPGGQPPPPTHPCTFAPHLHHPSIPTRIPGSCRLPPPIHAPPRYVKKCEQPYQKNKIGFGERQTIQGGTALFHS
jgi:hypothetical protein